MHALRFFRVVPLQSTFMLAGLATLGLYGVVVLTIDATSGMDVAVPVLLLHMFAVSSGFAAPAKRGHFDLLLTSGTPRIRIALAHWAASVAPGLLVWLAIGCLEWVRLGHPARVMSNGSVAAVVLISTAGWAATIALPRLTGGVVWVAALFVVVASDGWRTIVLNVAAGHGSNLEVATTFLVCPLFVVGTRLEWTQLTALVPGLSAGVLSVVGAILWIGRLDITLEAAQ